MDWLALLPEIRDVIRSWLDWTTLCDLALTCSAEHVACRRWLPQMHAAVLFVIEYEVLDDAQVARLKADVLLLAKTDRFLLQSLTVRRILHPKPGFLSDPFVTVTLPANNIVFEWRSPDGESATAQIWPLAESSLTLWFAFFEERATKAKAKAKEYVTDRKEVILAHSFWKQQHIVPDRGTS